LSLLNLCRLMGVTDRALRSCCAEFIGITPSRCMLLRRLKWASVSLRKTDPAATSAFEVARSCGFTELGRFAVAYRTVFGETPSTTLQRTSGSGILGPIFADSA
jgi:transcriptional regulator GlxA family with amidase domain